MKNKRVSAFLAVLVAALLLPATVFSAFAVTPEHTCSDPADCTVCTVADMINALPDTAQITIDNAAAVTEQIHAIDRAKVELDEDEYDELLTLVDNERPASGFGTNVPTRYVNAVEAIRNLTGGGSLFITKSYSTGDTELNWSDTDASFTVESLDNSSSFVPLQVTLADIEGSSLPGFYSMESSGWTNQYILPAGTYKVTETGYTATTSDGRLLETTATYDVDGTQSSNYAVVTIGNGGSGTVSVLNSLGTTEITVVFQDENGDPVSDAELQIGSTVFNEANTYFGEVDNLSHYDPGYDLTITAPAGYTAPDVTGVTFTPNDSPVLSQSVSGIEVTGGYDALTVTIQLSKLLFDQNIAFVDSADHAVLLEGAELTLLDEQDVPVWQWTSGTSPYLAEDLASGDYTLRCDSAPAGYFIPYDVTFSIDDAGNVNTSGHKDGNTLLMCADVTSVAIQVVDEEDSSVILSGAQLQLSDSQGNPIESWTSGAAAHSIQGLTVDETYTVSFTKAPDGYVLPESVTVSIDSAGTVNSSASTDGSTVVISCLKISHYYIPFLPKTLTYGEPFGGNVVDWDHLTLNGAPFYHPHIGQAFYLVCTDADGKVYDTRGGKLIPVGTYFMEGKANPAPEGVQDHSVYSFGPPVTVTVLPKELTADMFTVTAQEKDYDGTTDAVLSVSIRKEDPRNNISGIEINSYEGPAPVYDEVTAVISGEYEDAQVGTDKKITYSITALEGADAVNYKLPDGGISGELTNGVINGTGGGNTGDGGNGDADGGNGGNGGNNGDGGNGDGGNTGGGDADGGNGGNGDADGGNTGDGGNGDADGGNTDGDVNDNTGIGDVGSGDGGTGDGDDSNIDGDVNDNTGIGDGGSGDGSNAGNGGQGTPAPETGDAGHMWMWLTAMLISGAAMCLLIPLRRRHAVK